MFIPRKKGTLLNHSTARGGDRGGLVRFQALPLAEVEPALEVILDAHQTLARAGFVAVDLYGGCFLYDFEASEMFLIDLDEYRMGPFVLEQERLPGSRYETVDALVHAWLPHCS